MQKTKQKQNILPTTKHARASKQSHNISNRHMHILQRPSHPATPVSVWLAVPIKYVYYIAPTGPNYCRLSATFPGANCVRTPCAPPTP